MSHAALIVVACIVVFAETCLNCHAADPLDVNEQCRAKTAVVKRAGPLFGKTIHPFPGACLEAPLNGIYRYRCRKLRCALRLPNGSYEAVGTKHAADGTYCGYQRVCRNGQCTGHSWLTKDIGQRAQFICQGMPGNGIYHGAPPGKNPRRRG